MDKVAKPITALWLAVTGAVAGTAAGTGCALDRSPRLDRPGSSVPIVATGEPSDDPFAPGSGPTAGGGSETPPGSPVGPANPGDPTGPAGPGAPGGPAAPEDGPPPGDGPATAPPAITDDLVPDDVERDEGVVCETRGTWAIRATVDVAWGGRDGGLAALTDDGRGLITVHMLSRIERVDGQGNFVGNVRICGTQLPPFYSTTLCESYQPRFPDAVWESDRMPNLPLTGNIECAHPGCVMRFNPSTGLLGVDLKEPLSQWPAASQTMDIVCPDGEGRDCFPDHDDDRHPGITVAMVTEGIAPKSPAGFCLGGYFYRAPPLREDVAAIFGGVRRADRLHLGTRTTLGGVGVLADCTHGFGGGIAEGFASRAIGCVAEPGTFDANGDMRAMPARANEPCDGPQRRFIDENLPEYRLLAEGERPDPDLDVQDMSPSPGPRFSTVYLGGVDLDADCAMVRDADYR